MKTMNLKKKLNGIKTNVKIKTTSQDKTMRITLILIHQIILMMIPQVMAQMMTRIPQIMLKIHKMKIVTIIKPTLNKHILKLLITQEEFT